MKNVIKGVILVAFGVFLGISIQDTNAGKNYDELKQERLAKNRELRRANERVTQACYHQCMERCDVRR